MCGIAGYSLSARSDVPRTLAAQALLAGIAERGADAVGYAYRGSGAAVAVHKRRAGASALLDEIRVPADATQALLHVRDYTKGHPSIEWNNHPIRHGAVVGVHNGIVFNDDDIMAAHGFERAHPDMTVDSEAIFALLEESWGRASALEECRGSLAVGFMDERRADTLYVARGVGRPLWVGRSSHETFFASTRAALQVVERYVGVELAKEELDEGELVALRGGRAAWSERFRPDRSFAETPLPTVRAPQEGAACLSRLAALAAAA